MSIFRRIGIITENIRDILRGYGEKEWHGEQIILNYPFAVMAIQRIAEIRKDDVLAFKNANGDKLKEKRCEIRERRKRSGNNPSTPAK